MDSSSVINLKPIGQNPEEDMMQVNLILNENNEHQAARSKYRSRFRNNEDLITGKIMEGSSSREEEAKPILLALLKNTMDQVKQPPKVANHSFDFERIDTSPDKVYNNTAYDNLKMEENKPLRKTCFKGMPTPPITFMKAKQRSVQQQYRSK